MRPGAQFGAQQALQPPPPPQEDVPPPMMGAGGAGNLPQNRQGLQDLLQQIQRMLGQTSGREATPQQYGMAQQQFGGGQYTYGGGRSAPY